MQAMRDHSQAKDLDKTVGIIVASYANPETGLAWPKNEELAEWGISVRRIQAALRVLERIGELCRRPDMEDGLRRRVYEIRPTFGRQMSLLGEGASLGAPLGAREGARTEKGAREGAPSRAPVEGTLNPEPLPPPTPPASGGGDGELSEIFETTYPSTRSQGAARPRRRQTRRARHAPPPPAPCPLDDVTDLVALEDAWEAFQAALRGRLSEQAWARWGIWTGSAHAHRCEPGIVELGMRPELVGVFMARHARPLGRIAGREVIAVPCAAVLQSSDGRLAVPQPAVGGVR